MSVWTGSKWIVWVSLYLVPIVFIPWLLTLSWSRQHGSEFRPGLRHLFQRGELALISMVVALPIIWQLMQSHFMPQTIVFASVLLAITAGMASSVWVESYCRRGNRVAWDDARAWRDSRNIALAVFAMTTVIEILLDRFAQVAAL